MANIIIKTYNPSFANDINCDHPVVIIQNDSQMVIGDYYLQVTITYCTPGYRFAIMYYDEQATAPNDVLVKLAQVLANDTNVLQACRNIKWDKPEVVTVHKLGNSLLAVFNAVSRRVK